MKDLLFSTLKGYKKEYLPKDIFSGIIMAAVNADTIRKNTRSQHVLEKVGFRFVGEDEAFKYYRIEQ